MNYDVYLTEDLDYPDNLNPIDRKFLSETLKLIEIKNGRIYSKFVGEIITPHSHIFSFPKNLEDIELIEPIKSLLKKYKKEGGNLCKNSTFTLSKSGDYKSESYFFKRLKTFFLDFVTYEFIYPEETKKVHSVEPMAGRIDMVQTSINRQIYGDGITYDVIDKENNDEWLLDDIYYFVMKSLVESVGSSSDSFEIKRMKDYLIEEAGFSLNEILEENGHFKIKNKKGQEKKLTLEQIIDNIKKCNVNIIHNPIKNTLIDYFQNKKLTNSKFEINIFYTKDFEYVWEHLVKVALKDNPIEFGDLVDKFKKTITFRDYVPKMKLKEYLKTNNITKYKSDPDNDNYIIYTGYDARPDVFSSGVSEYSKVLGLKNDKLKFIGDAKYYNSLKSEFHKEFSTYNSIQDNFYPMVILVPSDRTYIPPRGAKYGDNIDDKRELIIINISIKDIINDYIDKTNYVLSQVHMLIKKRSKRVKNQLN